MIRIERPAPPLGFQGEAYERARDELDGHYQRKATKARQQTSFRSKGGGQLGRQVRPELESIQHGKCGYCETRVGPGARGQVDHYRPKRGTRGGDDVYLDSHYWWLQLEWDNLVLACPRCNMAKASWFPLVDESKRAPVGAMGADLAVEEPLILNPYVDDPKEHLQFADDGSVLARTPRGDATIAWRAAGLAE